MPGYANPTKTAIGKGTSLAGQCREMQNNAGTGVPDWHIIDTTETRFVPVGEPSKENAATSAKVNGVKSNVAVQIPLANNAPKTDGSAISKWAKPSYRKIAKALGLALILGAEWAWHGVTIAVLAHLTEQERAALVSAALNGLDEDNAYPTDRMTAQPFT